MSEQAPQGIGAEIVDPLIDGLHAAVVSVKGSLIGCWAGPNGVGKAFAYGTPLEQRDMLVALLRGYQKHYPHLMSMVHIDQAAIEAAERN